MKRYVITFIVALCLYLASYVVLFKVEEGGYGYFGYRTGTSEIIRYHGPSMRGFAFNLLDETNTKNSRWVHKLYYPLQLVYQSYWNRWD